MAEATPKLRLLVTGRDGQVVTALRELASDTLDVAALGRPELDLATPGDLFTLFRSYQPDVIVNAAAYTAVDKAETETDLAFAVNGAGAGAVAAAASALGVPVIQLSTDYVFDGSKQEPYLETDPTGPISAYGASKLAGESAVAAANPRHVILRTSWVYAPFGANFCRTMLRLAETRDELRVVGDQQGAPSSALDIADTIVKIARNVANKSDNKDLYGIFHMSAQGKTNWAEFAAAIFALSAARGGPTARVVPITSAEYPTPTKRPAFSYLDSTKLAKTHGTSLPHWHDGLVKVIARLYAA